MVYAIECCHADDDDSDDNDVDSKYDDDAEDSAEDDVDSKYDDDGDDDDSYDDVDMIMMIILF
jgi:hypothetical protein